MAQISYSKTGGMIRWDESDWLTGLIPQFSTSGHTRMIAQKGLALATAIDPFRKPGYLFPGNDATDYTNVAVIDALVKNGVNNGSTAYLVTAGTKLHSIDLATNTITSPALHTIVVAGAHAAHSAIVGSDGILYYVGTTKYWFYSYNDNTDGDVGRFDLSATYVENYMSGTAASGAVLGLNPHPLVVGADDILYIGDGNKLQAFDGQTGANGTYTASRLVLPKDIVITSFAKTGEALVIFGYKNTVGGSVYSSESFAFFWDYVSEDPYRVVPIQGSYVNGGFNFSGTIGVFAQGTSSNLDSSRSSRMMLFNGTGFESVKQFPENIPGNGGVFVADNVVYWNADGVIYRYGAPDVGFPAALNRIATLDGTTSEGMLRNFSNTIITASAGTTTSGGLQRLDGNYRNGATFFLPFVEPVFPEDHIGKVRKLKVYYYAIPEANCHPLTLNIRTGVSGTETVLNAKTTITSTPSGSCLTEVFRYKSDNTTLPFFDLINIYGSYGNGNSQSALPLIIKAVEIYYDNVKV